MGRSVSEPDLQWSLVSGGTGSAYQLPGVEGSIPNPEVLCNQSERPVGSDIVRQQHGGQLHKQRRGHEIQKLKRSGQGSDSLVFGAISVSDGCSRGRCRQRGRGCVVSALANAIPGPPEVHRMVPGSECGRPTLHVQGLPTVDLLATVANGKVERFFSLSPHPLEERLAPMVMPWDAGMLYSTLKRYMRWLVT